MLFGTVTVTLAPEKSVFSLRISSMQPEIAPMTQPEISPESGNIAEKFSLPERMCNNIPIKTPQNAPVKVARRHISENFPFETVIFLQYGKFSERSKAAMPAFSASVKKAVSSFVSITPF